MQSSQWIAGWCMPWAQQACSAASDAARRSSSAHTSAMRPAITSRPEPPDVGTLRRTLAALPPEPSANLDDPQATRVAAGGGMNARASVLVATNRVVAQVGGVCGLTVKGQLPRGGRWLGMLDGRRGLSVPADPLLRPRSASSGWGRGAGRSAADGSLKVWSQWVRVRRVPESAEKVVKAIPM